MTKRHRWDARFITLCTHIAGWSKDPNTKVGSVITRPDLTICSIGFNGFPRGISDDLRLADRQTKLDLTIHAEMNAILNSREPVSGYTLYCTPCAPCVRCAVHIVQAGISRVVSMPARSDYAGAKDVFDEAGVVFDVWSDFT